MRARLVVFPINGRRWCFSRSLDAVRTPESTSPPPRFKDLWRKITSDPRPATENAEIIADFAAEKMHRSWIGLENAPAGSLKSKLHSLGLRLLSRVKPSEVFLKSIAADVSKVEITYPASLNPRLVRRRLRHVALRGSAIHKKYFYGSISLLPLTTAFSVLPLPNIPFFWIVFRAYSHWRALKGSQRLLLLVTDCSRSWGSLTSNKNEHRSRNDLKHTPDNASHPPWVLQPSKAFERQLLLDDGSIKDGGVSCRTVSSICEEYGLQKKDVLKYRDSF